MAVARDPARAALEEPVFAGVAPDEGHYESYYLRAVAPDRPAAVWIRYTIHKAPGHAAAGSLWCTVFDTPAGPPRAVKQTFAAPRPGGWVEIGGHVFGPGRAEGAAEALGHSGRWGLEFDQGVGAVQHLPRRWMYRARLPRTKTLSPVSDARFTGFAEVDGHRVDLDGWRGMVGHNWGAEHAERWTWLHGIAFEGEPEAWLDMVAGRIRVGGRTLPWIANGTLYLDGETHTVGGLGALRKTEVSETPMHLELTTPPISLTVDSPREQIATWVYADPAGGEHHSAHCSVAAMELRLGERVLRTPHGACYELGMRETGHGLPVQPFPDGDVSP